MARKKKPVLWCKPIVCGQTYDVLIGNKDNCPWFDGDEEASIHWETTTIVVRDDLSDSRKEDCLMHEVVIHAIMEASGIKTILKEKFQFTEKDWDRFEENLATLYAPAILSTLKANGWIKIPKIPANGRTNTSSVVASQHKKAKKR